MRLVHCAAVPTLDAGRSQDRAHRTSLAGCPRHAAFKRAARAATRNYYSGHLAFLLGKNRATMDAITTSARRPAQKPCYRMSLRLEISCRTNCASFRQDMQTRQRCSWLERISRIWCSSRKSCVFPGNMWNWPSVTSGRRRDHCRPVFL